MCFQIRTLDKRRLVKHIGDLTDEEKQSEVIEALCFQLKILS
ncbi:MAG: type II toxin-antitoxin system PemK/MazF family toxin [Pyrinomonadaceae bacterium]